MRHPFLRSNIKTKRSRVKSDNPFGEKLKNKTAYNSKVWEKWLIWWMVAVKGITFSVFGFINLGGPSVWWCWRYRHQCCYWRKFWQHWHLAPFFFMWKNKMKMGSFVNWFVPGVFFCASPCRIKIVFVSFCRGFFYHFICFLIK